MYCNLSQIIDISLGKQKGGTINSLNEPLVSNSLQELLPSPKYDRNPPPRRIYTSTTKLPQEGRVSNSLQQLLPSPNFLINQSKKQVISSIDEFPPRFNVLKKPLQNPRVIGKGSVGEITLMSGLPQVNSFSAVLSSLVVTDKRVSIKNTKLNIDDYLRFQQENEDLLVAKYFVIDIAFKEEADAIRLMLSKLHGQIVEDCTIMNLIDKKKTQYTIERSFNFMLEVLGKKFLLFKRMDGSLDKVYNSLTLTEKINFFYRTALTVYAYEYHTLKSGCFHRDIKPQNILYKKTTLSNGKQDFLILIGDFDLFTNGSEEQYNFFGTPNFMYFKNIDDMNIDIDKYDISSIYDIGMFINDTYAYIGTLEYLSQSLNIKELNNYIDERKNNLVLLLNNRDLYKKTFADLFVMNSPHPKNIMRILLDNIQKVSVKKIFNPSKTVYKNSFIADIALHELDSYMTKNNKKGIVVNDIVSIYRPNGSEYDNSIYLNLEGPFAYTYLFALILDGIQVKSLDKKDIDDYMYNYDPNYDPTIFNNIPRQPLDSPPTNRPPRRRMNNFIL